MTVKLVRKGGAGILYAGEKTAEKLLASGAYRVANGQDLTPRKVAETAVEETKQDSQGEDTPEDAPKLPEASEAQEDRPDANVVREWAVSNGVEVSQKGRVSQQVYDAYAEAHKE